MRKIKVILIILLISVFCTSAFAVEEKVVLSFLHYKQEIADQLDKLAKLFNEQYPDITINIARVPDYMTVLKAKIASGDAPDIYAIQSVVHMKNLVDLGLMEDLTNEPFMKRIVEAAKPIVTYNGKIYALPLDIAGIGVIYNKDIFEKAGITSPPKTVSELKEVIQKIKNIGVIPFGVTFKDSWTLNHLFSMGQAATVEPIKFVEEMNAGKAQFWNDKMNKVFETFDLIGENCNERPFECDYVSQTTMFAQEKTAMMTQGLWAMQYVFSVNPDINAGMFGLPVFEDPDMARLMVEADFRLSINAESKNVEAAKKFLDFMTSKVATDIWIKECKLISSVVGTKIDAIGSDIALDEKSYSDSGKTYPWGYRYWPGGLNVDIGKLMQKYYLGELTKEQVCSTMDDLWKKAVSK